MVVRSLASARNAVLSFGYKNIVKPYFFLHDPETVHDRTTRFGSFLGSTPVTRGLTSLMFNYRHPSLRQRILGIDFRNPVGLAGGFDKEAMLTDILPSIGFGFMEVGSITGEPCPGNPKPRLWRLKKSKGIQVYYGLKNAGCEVISGRLSKKSFAIPLGTNVAKTNSRKTVKTDAAIKDYLKAYKALASIGHYTTVNISCPNAYGGQPFNDSDLLDQLLSEIDKVKTSKPVFLKMSPDLSERQLDGILDIASKHRIHGFICTNLTKKKSTLIKEKLPGLGGVSGKPVEPLSNRMISEIRSRAGKKYVLIGTGGIFSAEDAYRKIRLGASLVQLITGMIFNGPQIVSSINIGLSKLLERDGFSNISDAVGVDAE